MSTRTRQIVMYGVALAAAIAAALVLFAASASEANPEAPPAAAVASVAAPVQAADPAVPVVDPHTAMVEELMQLAAINLRGPVAAAAQSADPAAPPAAPSASSITLHVRLLGTITEPGHSMGVFQRSDGAIEVRGEGQTVTDPAGAVKVRRVERRKVLVEFGGTAGELTVPIPGSAAP